MRKSFYTVWKEFNGKAELVESITCFNKRDAFKEAKKLRELYDLDSIRILVRKIYVGSLYCDEWEIEKSDIKGGKR